MAKLLDPIQVGDLSLPNRVIMAPLTRLRGTPDHLPTPIMADYYRQRTSAGLIISEGTPVSPMGVGYAQVPGIWSQEQTELWKPITAAVHEGGGRIFAQIWHVGRVSHSRFLNGKLPVGPSAIPPGGHVNNIRPEVPFETPHALTIEEIKLVVEHFRQGAQNAKDAGFDGVEIHGANGYLLDQFLHSGSNERGDEYGGAIENRGRLMLEVADAAISVWGAGRVGMHLAPRGDVMSMSDQNPRETFLYVASELGKRKLAFLMAREYYGEDRLGPELKQAFGGVYIANEKYTFEQANKVIEAGEADAVGFGKLFISNPDLPARFAKGAPLNDFNSATFYTHGPEGYVDYPSLGEE
ncbi:2,4-dienoyl-CoA reductase [Granulicella rosea]|uniref:2,4-dienoyl-CoA reductase n=1 Tax=Granulicella rosea TaxID=474952 RepID=A0A239EGC3_9BACT|nr:alkene reductase [Granulicella rosea]SNS43677.1 2,4-dienoyl-CoA reductase [Granulicella rosea]